MNFYNSHTKENFEEYKQEAHEQGEDYTRKYVDWLEMQLIYAKALEKNHDGTIDKEYERIVKILTKRIGNLRRNKNESRN